MVAPGPTGISSSELIWSGTQIAKPKEKGVCFIHSHQAQVNSLVVTQGITIESRPLTQEKNHGVKTFRTGNDHGTETIDTGNDHGTKTLIQEMTMESRPLVWGMNRKSRPLCDEFRRFLPFHQKHKKIYSK